MKQLRRAPGLLAAVAIVVLVGLVVSQLEPADEDDVGAIGPTPSPSMGLLSPEPGLPEIPVLPSVAPDPADGDRSETPGPNQDGLACGVHFSHVAWDARFFEPEFLTDYSTAVVAGTVTDVGGGRWATADGKPPVDEYGFAPAAWQVYHIVEVELGDVGKHPDDDKYEIGSVLELRAFGGTIGCLSFRVAGAFQFAEGDEVAVFLGQQSGLADAPSADADVVMSWPINGDSVGSGLMTVDDLLDLGRSN